MLRLLLLGLGAELAAGLDTLEDVLTVFVELELGDDDLAGVDAQRDALARGLVAGDTLNVDNVLETVHGSNLALTALVGAADNGDLIVLADGNAADLLGGRRAALLDMRFWLADFEKGTAGLAYVVLLTELLGQRSAHDVAADAGRGREVSLPRLAPGGGNA